MLNKNYAQIIFRLFIIAFSTFLFLFFCYYTFKVAYPFIIGLIIAFFMNPLVNLIQEKARVPRWLAVSFVLIIVIGTLIGTITFLISEVIMGTNYLSQSVPLHFQTLIDELKRMITNQVVPIYEQLSALFYSLDSDHQVTILNYIETIMTHFSANASSTIQSLLTGVSDFLLSLPNLATVIIFSLLATFFISKDWYKLVFLFRKWTPKTFVHRTKDVMISLKKAFFGFLLAQLTLITITCCIVLIGLLILRVEYPITISFIIAFVDLIPYMGTGLIFIPWIFYTFFSGQLSLTIGLSILYGVIVIQRQVMEPKILSSSIGVDPLATLLSLFVGFKLVGFLGLIIGPVVLVLIQTLHNAHVFRDLKNFVLKG